MDLPENHVYMIITIIQSYFLLIIIFVYSNKILQNFDRGFFYLKNWIACQCILLEMRDF